jgi:hypothetical protein
MKTMPIHDWTRVVAGIFHDFHSAWITEIRNRLNTGLLPDDYYALSEQIAGSLGPDVRTRRAEVDCHTLKQRQVVIRHVSNHRIVALVEIVSAGNRGSCNDFRSFLTKSVGAIAKGIHLLIVDLFPPGKRDPQGVHVSLWQELMGEPPEPPPNKLLTLAAYDAGSVTTAYVNPIEVGDVLPEMPLFLDPEEYVNVPLESTYQSAYAGVPRFYRAILERLG